MKTKIRWNLRKGETRTSICEKITRHMWQYFRMLEMDGKIGIENTVSNDDLRTEVAKLINEKNWVTPSERCKNIDRYQLFIERQTRQSINKLISPTKGNMFFIPGLLNNPFHGYFIASNDIEIEEIRNDKQYHIEGCIHNLKHRTLEATEYIKTLPPHIKEKLIDSGENREII